MNIKVYVSAHFLLVFSLSCGDSQPNENNQQSAKQNTREDAGRVRTKADALPPPVPKGTSQNLLPLAIDFENQAESTVNESNYKSKLLELAVTPTNTSL